MASRIGLEEPEVASYLTYKGFGMPSHGGGWHPGLLKLHVNPGS